MQNVMSKLVKIIPINGYSTPERENLMAPLRRTFAKLESHWEMGDMQSFMYELDELQTRGANMLEAWQRGHGLGNGDVD